MVCLTSLDTSDPGPSNEREGFWPSWQFGDLPAPLPGFPQYGCGRYSVCHHFRPLSPLSYGLAVVGSDEEDPAGGKKLLYMPFIELTAECFARVSYARV